MPDVDGRAMGRQYRHGGQTTWVYETLEPIVLTDRSPICTLALAHYLGIPVPPLLHSEIARIRRELVYDHRVFFVEELGFIRPTAARRISRPGFAAVRARSPRHLPASRVSTGGHPASGYPHSCGADSKPPHSLDLSPARRVHAGHSRAITVRRVFVAHAETDQPTRCDQKGLAKSAG
jgi:hypothetical protein